MVLDLTRYFNDPLVRNTIWGVHIRSLDRGETVYAINDRTLLLPVSAMKLVTLAAAAALGNPDHSEPLLLLPAPGRH